MKFSFTSLNIIILLVRINGLHKILVLATGKRNSNAAMVFSFLYKFQEILIEYFKELEEESIRFYNSTMLKVQRQLCYYIRIIG